MTTIRVYFKSGQTFAYEVADGNKAREHCYAIWKTGYRANDGKVQTWYGPHWIDKIVVVPAPSTSYTDTSGGT